MTSSLLVHDCWEMMEVLLIDDCSDDALTTF